MEGFPLDIQRLVLEQVCYYTPDIYLIGQLFPLLSVNRMFRRWVMRYIFDTPDKDYILRRIREILRWPVTNLDEFESWHVYDILRNQWTPDRMVSFIMYLDSLVYSTRPCKICQPKANELFLAR